MVWNSKMKSYAQIVMDLLTKNYIKIFKVYNSLPPFY